MAACIQNDYERDYIIEALMHDRLHQKQKYRKKSFDFRRTTKAHQGNVNAAKKKIQAIREKEMHENSAMGGKRNSMPATKLKKASNRGDFLARGAGINKPVKAVHSELELRNEAQIDRVLRDGP